MKHIILLSLAAWHGATAQSNHSGEGMKNDTNRLVLVQQHTGTQLLIIGLKTVPDFYEGSITSYAQEMAQKSASHQTVMAYVPSETGIRYTTTAVHAGPITFEAFSDDSGMTQAEAIKALKHKSK